MAYNITNITRGDITLFSFYSFGNEVTGGWLGIVILFLLFTVPFLSLLPVYGEKRAAATASYITAMGSIALLLTNLIPFIVAVFAWVLTGGVIVWLLVNNE